MTKLYRCGYCGRPTDENGVPLEMTDAMASLDWDKAEPTHGECCINYGAMTNEEFQYVTREMAMDAGCPEMEGMRL